MKRVRSVLVAGLASTVMLVAALVGTAPRAGAAGSVGTPAKSPSGPNCPWLDQSLPVSQRVAMLLPKMTLADKITLVEGQGTSKPYVFYMAGVPKLCIPPMGEEDGPLGVGDGLRGVTQLPAGVSLASTWNPSLAASYGKVVGSEEAGKGASVNLGPTVNILRDPRWGRTFESFTEDPYLNSALAVGEIKGVQSQGVLSQVKHYAAYNQETYRNAPADNVIVSPRALHEIYLPAFHAAVTKGKAASVMCAYSTVNGKYSCQDPFLLTHVLHQRWGFKGFVTSDYAAIHSLSAAAAGTDQEQPFATYFGQPLEQAVASGAIPESVLDTMVRRILTEMFRFGLFNHPRTGSTSAVVTTPAHQAVATSVAEAGTVLLKNKAQTLPLRSSNDATVAVIGPSASASSTDVGGGSAHVTAPFRVTPLAGIQAAAAGAGAKVVYSQG
ncbi:MAG: glycoside hydrolase family 3 protein, partial [Acidimicrobiales bacterium]